MKKESNGINRRTFIGNSTKGAMGLGVAGMAAQSQVFGMDAGNTPASSPADGNPNQYYKYMYTPASVVDFGLTPQQEERAKELHAKLHIFDSLMECSWYDGLLENLKLGGNVAGSFSIGTAGLHNWRGITKNHTARMEDWWTAETLFKDLSNMNRLAQENADKMKICLNVDDLRQAKKEGKIGFMFDIQNTVFLRNEPQNIEYFYNIGLRRVQMTYNRQNYAGSGCMEKNDYGLAIWGVELIERMNDLGMLVDTGHCKPQTVIDSVKASKKPISCSHAGMSSRVNNPRTQSDAAIKAVADGGGVFGVVSTPGALNGKLTCSVKDYVDTIDAAVNVAGIDHVGFGTDLILAASLQEIVSAPEWGVKAVADVGVDSDAVWPWSDGHLGMENNSGYMNLTRGLIAKGYSDKDIAKIMGENFIRLYGDVIV